LAPLVAALRARMPGTWVRVLDGPLAGAEDSAESVRRALPERLPQGRTSAEVLAALPTVDIRSSRAILAELREVQAPAGIAAIRAATDATARGFLDALRAARPGVSELQLAGVVELRCRLGGCAHQAYPSIVGSGPNSCVLHYMRNDRVLADGDMVC